MKIIQYHRKKIFRIVGYSLLTCMVFMGWSKNSIGKGLIETISKHDKEILVFSVFDCTQQILDTTKRICTVSRVAFIANEPNHIYTNVDVFPEYKTGTVVEMNRFIEQAINYPKWEKENDVKGRVFVEFVVEKDGSLDEFKVLRVPKGSKNLEKEALRVIKLMPKWKPGKLDGHVVRTRYVMPVMFSLSGG